MIVDPISIFSITKNICLLLYYLAMIEVRIPHSKRIGKANKVLLNILKKNKK